MILFPAIDVLDGKCVRLLYGDRAKVTVYGDAVDMAKKWCDSGAEYLHVVDLNGAFGEPGVNRNILEKLFAAVPVPVQTGGGVRTIADAERLLGAGAARVILGTAAVEDPALVAAATARFGEKVACGIDVKNGSVAVRGWTEESGLSPAEFGRRLKAAGVSVVIYTDVSRDGALTGVDAEGTATLQRDTGLNVIASGGVRNARDIARLKQAGVYGVVLGKSLYEGTLDLPEALCLARESFPV